MLPQLNYRMDDSVINNLLLPQQQNSSLSSLTATTSKPTYPTPSPPTTSRLAQFNALLTPSPKDEEQYSLLFTHQLHQPHHILHQHQQQQQHHQPLTIRQQHQSGLVSNHLLELQKEIKEEEEEIFADINSLINRGSQHLYSNLVEDDEVQHNTAHHALDNDSKFSNRDHRIINSLNAHSLQDRHRPNNNRNDTDNDDDPHDDNDDRFCDIIGRYQNKSHNSSSTSQKFNNFSIFHNNHNNNTNQNHLRNYLIQQSQHSIDDDLPFKANNIISEKDNNYQRHLANGSSTNLQQPSSLPARHQFSQKFADWDDEKIISSTTDDLAMETTNKKQQQSQFINSQQSFGTSQSKSLGLMRDNMLLGQEDDDDDDDDEDIKFLRYSSAKQDQEQPQQSHIDNSIEQDEDEEHNNYMDEHTFASCSQVDQQDYQKLQAVIQQVTSNLPKPCVFFLEGNCRRIDCKYSHDLSNITCKYWIEGFCFKGELCPFLHGYTPNDPQDSGLLDEDAIKSLSKKKFYPTFVIESEADFPSLPLDAPLTALNDSSKSSNDTDTITTTIKNQILNSNPAVVFKTIKKKRKRG